jgi:hypothetical protein
MKRIYGRLAAEPVEDCISTGDEVQEGKGYAWGKNYGKRRPN